MSIQINYKNSSSKKPSNNLILFADEKFNINSIKKFVSRTEFFYISDLLKTSDLSKKLFIYEITSKKKNSSSFNKKRFKRL